MTKIIEYYKKRSTVFFVNTVLLFLYMLACNIIFSKKMNLA